MAEANHTDARPRMEFQAGDFGMGQKPDEPERENMDDERRQNAVGALRYMEIEREEPRQHRNMEAGDGIPEIVGGMQDLLREMRNNRIQQTPSHSHRVAPDIYHGKTSWDDYFSHFKTVAELNGWNEHEKALFLAASLRGEASQVLRCLPQHILRNFTELCTTLSKRFDPGNRTELFRIQLRNRVRKDKETLPELAQSIRNLAAQAYPQAHGNLLEDLCRDHFLDALQDSELRYRIFQAHPRTLDDAVGVAVETEAFQQADKQRTRKYVREVDTKPANYNTFNKEKELAEQSNLNLDKKINEFMEILQNWSKSHAPSNTNHAFPPTNTNHAFPPTNTNHAYAPRNGNHTYTPMNKVTCYHCKEQGH